jgi:ubiquinone/menaquinone biosynthesis C-methylase UbiE
MNIQDLINEKETAKAFSKQALIFDAYDAGNTIIHYKRQRVREHVLRYLPPQSSILELNAGTGTDAVFFAGQGHYVHATDIADGMQQKLKEKVQQLGLTNKVTAELCSFTALSTLRHKGPYDLIFSNFAGLNCTRDLQKVLDSFGPLLKPGGQVTLVILPPFSLWETLLLFRGNAKMAFRRLFSRQKGAPAHVEGVHFRCWYHSPALVRRTMKKNAFQLLGLEGLCTIVPPSYMDKFTTRFPNTYRILCAWEDRWKDRWPWRTIGDYYIISFRKK